jgi:hypothetical protein
MFSVLKLTQDISYSKKALIGLDIKGYDVYKSY